MERGVPLTNIGAEGKKEKHDKKDGIEWINLWLHTHIRAHRHCG